MFCLFFSSILSSECVHSSFVPPQRKVFCLRKDLIRQNLKLFFKAKHDKSVDGVHVTHRFLGESFIFP